MNETLCHKLKSQLEQKEAELRSRLSEDYAQLTLEEGEFLTDPASRAEALRFQRIALELGARKQRQLLQVQTALEAIATGNYGRCRKCGQAISSDRLDIQPEVLLCISCAATI